MLTYLDAVEKYTEVMGWINRLLMQPTQAATGAKEAVDNSMQMFEEARQKAPAAFPPAWTSWDMIPDEYKDKIKEGAGELVTGQVAAVGIAKQLLSQYRKLKKRYDGMNRLNPLRLVLSKQLSTMRKQLRAFGVKV